MAVCSIPFRKKKIRKLRTTAFILAFLSHNRGWGRPHRNLEPKKANREISPAVPMHLWRKTMRFFRFHGAMLLFTVALALGFTLNIMEQRAYSQETTGGLQGTVKDPTGAVVPGASVTVTAPTLVGSKETTTDSAGYYRFANL